MNRRATRVAAAALATAAIVSAPAAAPPDPLAEVERRASAAEERLRDVERVGATPEEPALERARRRFEDGLEQHRRGAWGPAAALLAGALEEPAFRGAPDQAEAVFLLADALRRAGATGAARLRYAEYLALGAPGRRAEAVSGALECAVRERRAEDVDALLAEAARTFGPELPVEVRYLAAKALFQRTDLPTGERLARAAAAFQEVGAPYALQAQYFLGVVELERENLHGSLPWFERCARARPEGPKETEVRDLCLLALGRVHGQMGNAAAAVDWYASLAHDSPRFPEALYELAWSYVRMQEHGRALRTASFVAELAPDSPLAPEATVLQGHLLLRLGRFAEAMDAYNTVINRYAPVRDELDAILSLREDPVRYFNELVGGPGKALDASTVLPAVAVRWASGSEDVAAALGLVESLDRARRDLRDAAELADRLEVLLARGGGLDAFPSLRRAYAGAQAVENDAALLEGEAVGALAAAALPALGPEGRAALERAHAARLALETPVRALPRTPEDADARLDRMRARLDEVDRAAYQAGFDVEALLETVGGTERWIDEHRAEIDSDPEARRDLVEELRKHREVVEGYGEALRAVRADVDRARDAAGGAEAVAEESRARAEYLAALAAEREAAEAARPSLGPQARAEVERAAALVERLAGVRARSRALEVGLSAEAGVRARDVQGEVAAERAVLAGHLAALDGVQAAARQLVGEVAQRSFEEVRAQFYRVVLKADVGIVDVAWARKRQRLEKIQQLSVQKASEVEQLDREYGALLREVD